MATTTAPTATGLVDRIKNYVESFESAHDTLHARQMGDLQPWSSRRDR